MCNTARALIALSAIAALAQAAAVDSTAATAGAESQGAAAAAASESTTSSRPDTIVLKGIVYEDANNNGVLDAGEAVNSDAQVWLLPGSDATGPAQSLDWPSARADNNGYYEFSWLRLSGYKNIVSGNARAFWLLCAYEVVTDVSCLFSRSAGAACARRFHGALVNWHANLLFRSAKLLRSGAYSPSTVAFCAFRSEDLFPLTVTARRACDNGPLTSSMRTLVGLQGTRTRLRSGRRLSSTTCRAQWLASRWR